MGLVLRPSSPDMHAGFPLSPLIFGTAIETLTIAIRNHPDIHGIQCGLHSHKCTLFADDILLFISSPLVSLPNICRLLEDFGKISGLHINYAKSQALNITIPSPTVLRLKENFEFTWSDSKIPYLGVNLAPKIDLLFAANYPPLFKKLESDLTKWAHHGLSWLGRINAIKMTLLPRILYFFRSLSIQIIKACLQLQSKIITFIWGNKGHRLSKSVLFLARNQGGFGLPNLFWYY